MAIVRVLRPTLTPEEFLDRLKKIEKEWSRILKKNIVITDINMDNVVGDKQIILDYLKKNLES